MVQIIRDNARRLERMVHDVLELSRRDRVQPEPIRVRQYLLTFIEEFARNEGQIPGDSFSVEAANDVTVEFDRTQPQPGAVETCCTMPGGIAAGSPEACVIAASRRANRVRIARSSTTAKGVPKPLQAQLFEPFFTTFRERHGARVVHRARAVRRQRRRASTIWIAARERISGFYGRNR